jgi:hypothetical protein
LTMTAALSSEDEKELAMSVFEANSVRRLRRLFLLIAMPLIMLVGCPARSSSNNPPEAKPGDNQVVAAGTNVTLDGSASSDPDGDALAFFWKQTRGASVALSSASTPQVTFTAPATGTTLAFELTVSDGKSSSAKSVSVSVHPVEQTARVVEIRQPSIQDDPAVNGDFPNDWTAPGPPPEPAGPPGEGANELMGETQFAPLLDTELSPGTTREVELDVAAGSTVMGSARWIGTTDPLEVKLTLGGAPVATGVSYSLGTNRGGAAVQVPDTVGGHAILSVANTSDVTVRLRVVLGAVD